MLNLETGVVALTDEPPRRGELAVGEDIAIGERLRLGRCRVVATRDAVVEQAATVAQLRVQEREVVGVVLHADVLREADRADGVEARLGDVAVVAVADLDEALEARLTHGALTPLGLLLAQGDAYDVDAALASGVHRHAAPAAADVEQPLAGLQVELVGNEGELALLRFLEGVVRRVEHGARVGHRVTEHLLVERVRDVIVVLDRVGGATHRVHLGEVALPAGLVLDLGQRRVDERLRPQLLDDGRERRRDALRRQLLRAHVTLDAAEHLVGVTRVETGAGQRARQIGAGEAEIARGAEEVAQPLLALDTHGDVAVARADVGAVVRRDAEGQRLLQHGLDGLGDEGGGGRGLAHACVLILSANSGRRPCGSYFVFMRRYSAAPYSSSNVSAS